MSTSRARKHRERLACAACRQRKLKCDRESPCGSCVRRRDVTSCSYEVSIDSDRRRNAQAQARLEHLEHLVGSLMGQRSKTTIGVQNGNVASELPNSSDPAEQTGAWSSSRSDFCYQDGSGTTHWSAMLDDIRALRSTLDPFEEDDRDDGDTSAPQAGVDLGMGVMFGASLSQSASIEQILNAHLPSRRNADRLLSTYFRTRSYVTPYIHSVQFQRQYEAFWRDPRAASPLWISILFSILFIATNISRTGKENEAPGPGLTVAAAQCLALGEYFRPKAFCFEALLLYIHSHFITRLEISPDVAGLLSMLAHIGTVSGYHRESSVSSLSPFEAEMRRRAWSTFMQVDLLVSFHLGVPSRVSLAISDTRASSNLLDSDFDERVAQLPSSRPDTELTGVSFSILKHKFMMIFDKILQHALSNNSKTAEDDHIDSLDTELKTLYESLPDIYRYRPMESCIVDPPQLIVARLCITFVYYKSLCVLHRPHVPQRREKSIQKCYQASCTLITYLLQVYEECKPGGQLETEEWFVKSITWHDLLLGATTLCLVAFATHQSPESYDVDQTSVLVLLEKVRAVIQDEKSEDGARSRSRALSIMEATISHLRVHQSGEGIRTMADVPVLPPASPMQEFPDINQDIGWKPGEGEQVPYETDWDYLNELFGASDHDMFTTLEMQGL
ncbi:uncharacterized protein FIESC28_03391 [Fusarium coffeatum]|uniref:Zn(2)-C6 fungal-type domain-containing protein n=1 Tax=Fusarium coffeatum TaxID=231269 RepID=A0A366S551_9HYPO|nr:uncharacterized protein FIESC28_03391 [Fusarium coffeatum]RBR23775.1 hypothetical protein FIESC28_03391 [Fusarium coffeatum]